jgi:hypothetical protein
MTVGQIMQIVFSLFVIPLVLLPTLGGGFVTLGFQIAKMPKIDYWRCWKICMASCCYAFLAMVPVGFIMQASEQKHIVQLITFIVVQLVLIPSFLRNFSIRALTIAGAGVVLSNVVVGIAYLLVRNSLAG